MRISNSKLQTPKIRRRILGFAILWIAASTACGAAPSALTPTLEGATATPTSVLANSTPVPATTPDAAAQQTLRLWLPPQFAPSADTPGGKVMLAQLAAFEEAQGWRVDVRVKKVAGQGGLIDSLHSALQAAPSIAPDVIALDTSMLSAAEGDIQPLPQFAAGDVVDFYPFALQAARVGDALIALPFAADAIGMAYSTVAYPAPPSTWSDFAPESGPVWLPLNDPSALITLQQYIALGGSLTDSAGQPALDAARLAQVLSDYQALQAAGLLPAASFETASIDDTWVTYRESRASAATAFFGSYLLDRRRVAVTGFALIPTHNGARSTFARQWNYALVTADPARQVVALDLMRWLTEPDNLGVWTFASAVLPTRSQALSEWRETSLASIADQLLNAAQPEPPLSVTAALGPPITAAVQAVFNGQASPEAAADSAAAAVTGK